MKIAFQTLACPDWEWEKILDEAGRLGYDGLELRGINGQMFLPDATPFLPENIEFTIADLKSRGLEICCLDSSTAYHNAEKLASALQEGRAYIDLAQKLGVPYIRTFGDFLPAEEKTEVVLERIAQGLNELGNYAADKGVTVLLETHGDINNASVIKAIFAQVESKAVGLLWDFEHPYLHGEEPETTYAELSSYLKHTHVKDARRTADGKELCLIGEGDVPVAHIIKLLKNNGYDGWLSLEFEKKWAPYLEEPEVSLPAFLSFVKNSI